MSLRSRPRDEWKYKGKGAVAPPPSHGSLYSGAIGLKPGVVIPRELQVRPRAPAHAVAPTNEFFYLSGEHADKLNGQCEHDPITLNEYRTQPGRKYKKGVEYFRVLRSGKTDLNDPNSYWWFEPKALYNYVKRSNGVHPKNPVTMEPLSEADVSLLKQRFDDDTPMPLRPMRRSNETAFDEELLAQANEHAQRTMQQWRNEQDIVQRQIDRAVDEWEEVRQQNLNITAAELVELKARMVIEAYALGLSHAEHMRSSFRADPDNMNMINSATQMVLENLEGIDYNEFARKDNEGWQEGHLMMWAEQQYNSLRESRAQRSTSTAL